MESQELEIDWSCALNGSEERTYEGDQADPNLAKLLDDALCCTKRSRRDDSIVSPFGIEGTTQRLKNLKKEKSKLSHDSDQRSVCWRTVQLETDHVNVSGHLQQLPVTIWERILITNVIPLRRARCCQKRSK